MTPDALTVQDLRISLGRRTLCRDLSFSVASGECCVVVGPNGAGKTTLLRTLAGLHRPQAGSIAYGGENIHALGVRECARRRAWLPQVDHDAFPATALEVVLVGRHPHLDRWSWETRADTDIAHQALCDVELTGFESRDVATLSGGERRRVALAGMLAQRAPLLLLDEPTSHLDLKHQIDMLQLLSSRARSNGQALVMVLHDLHLALRYADTAIAIGNGHASVGSATDILTRDRLSALFGHPLLEVGQDAHRTLLPA